MSPTRLVVLFLRVPHRLTATVGGGARHRDADQSWHSARSLPRLQTPTSHAVASPFPFSRTAIAKKRGGAAAAASLDGVVLTGRCAAVLRWRCTCTAHPLAHRRDPYQPCHLGRCSSRASPTAVHGLTVDPHRSSTLASLAPLSRALFESKGALLGEDAGELDEGWEEGEEDVWNGPRRAREGAREGHTTPPTAPKPPISNVNTCSD